MLPFPDTPALENYGSFVSRSCYKIGQNRIVTTESRFELILVNYSSMPALLLKVLDYDETKLDANYKYSTESRSYATVEFFYHGYYRGHDFLMKEKQVLYPKTVQFGNLSLPWRVDVVTAMAVATANGYTPCFELVDRLPDPQDPDPDIATITFTWISYYIKPSPSVVLQVMTP